MIRIPPNGCFDGMYSFRYLFIKYFCCPLPFIPYSIPIIGGRTFLDVIVIVIIALGFIITASSDLTSAGYSSGGSEGNGNENSGGESYAHNGKFSGSEASILGSFMFSCFDINLIYDLLHYSVYAEYSLVIIMLNG